MEAFAVCVELLKRKGLLSLPDARASFLNSTGCPGRLNSLPAKLPHTQMQILGATSHQSRVRNIWPFRVSLNPVRLGYQLTGVEKEQLSHMTTVDPAIYIQPPVSCLLRGIIWQSDKQRDRQTDKQSVGYSQSSHCQSHCHSVPVSGPTAKGQYLSRQSPSLPNIEQHAVAVCPPSDFWTRLSFLFPSSFSWSGCFVLNLLSCRHFHLCHLLIFTVTPFVLIGNKKRIWKLISFSY